MISDDVRVRVQAFGCSGYILPPILRDLVPVSYDTCESWTTNCVGSTAWGTKGVIELPIQSNYELNLRFKDICIKEP